MAAVWAWPVPWALYGRREGVARPQRPVWPTWGRGLSPRLVWLPWGRGPSPELRMAAVVAWLVPRDPYGRRGGVARPLRPRMAAVGAWPVPWAPYGRRPFFGPLMDAVGAWPVPWAPYGRRGGVAGPLGPIRPP